MKNISLIGNAVLAVAMIVIYVLFFSSKNKTSENTEAATSEGTEVPTDLTFAYIKVDSLILNYDLAQELHDSFTKSQESYTRQYANQRTKFETEAASFQEKVQRGGFLTEQIALKERDRLVAEQEKIQKLDQELSTKLAELQSINNERLRDSLMNYLNMYNKNKKYSYILDASAILIGEEMHNITAEVLNALNTRYSPPKK